MVTFIHINITEAKNILSEKSNSILIDIRADEDYDESFDPRSVHITGSNIESFIINTPKDTPLIIMCYHGNSSQQIAQYLTEEGFLEVYSLDGGYEEWRKYL